MSILRSKYGLILIVLGVFLVTLTVEGGSHLYFGLRYSSAVLPLKDFYLRKFYKASNSVLATQKRGLPVVRLYLSEQSQSKLLENPPRSTKKWQPGKISFEDNILRPAKIRHRGDAPRNFTFSKKSWKIKLKKKNLLGRQRIFNFILPRSNIIRDIIPYWVAEEMGMLTPQIELVELILNDKPHGVMIMAEQLDESFLRNNSLMPVNIYKGEAFNRNAYVGPFTRDLLSNTSVWAKSARDNSRPKEYRHDLHHFMSQVSKAATDPHEFEKLRTIAPFEIWARFAAFQELVQSWHNSHLGNLRLIFDNWKGLVEPIPWDTYYGYINGEPAFDRGSHELLLLYLRHSEFTQLKNQMLHSFLEKQRPLQAVAKRLENLAGKLEISLDRDSYFKAWSASEFGILSRAEKVRQDQQEIIKSLRTLHSRLLSNLEAKPDARWFPEANGFSLLVSGRQSLADISLLTVTDGITPKSPEKLGVWLDMDQNGRVGPNDVPINFTRDGNGIRLMAKLMANRFLPSAGSFSIYSPQNLIAAPARFQFILNRKINISEVVATNSLTSTVYRIKRGVTQGAQPAIWNRPIQPIEARTPRVLSGEVVVSENLTIKDDVKVLPGTTFRMAAGVTLVLRGKVLLLGTMAEPVRVLPFGARPWGAFVLQGAGTQGSRLENLLLRDGSGGTVDGIRYTAMLSIHDTDRILVNHLNIDTNHEVDDMIHIVYGNEISLQNITLANARADAIDVDISHVEISDVTILTSGNDGIDFMDSKGLVQRARIQNARDKGISVGEGSNVFVVDSVISHSKIGVESKDGSSVKLLHTDLHDNETQLSAYRKNWRYGSGGRINVSHSILSGSKNVISSKKGSQIVVEDSSIWPQPKIGKRIALAKTVTFDQRRLALTGALIELGEPFADIIFQQQPNPWHRGASR